MRIPSTQRNLQSEFGDSRLVSRYQKIISNLSKDLTQSLPAVFASRSQAQATYRFFDNKNVNIQKMLHLQHRKLTELFNQFKDPPIIKTQRFLWVCDGSELDFTKKKSATKLGPLNYRRQMGMLLHSSILTTDQGVPIELAYQSYTVRSEENFGKSIERSSLPLEKKEGFKWVEHFKKAQSYVESHNEIELVFLADSEADMIELMQKRTNNRMHFLVRSKFNRTSADDDTQKIYTKISGHECVGTYRAQITDPKTGQERDAELEVRFCPVSITQQRQMKSTPDRSIVDLNLVEVKEINIKDGTTNPIEWRLLTSLPITDLESALEVIQMYIMRWVIERFHFLLKSGGAEIEELQLETEQRLQNAVTIYSVSLFKALKLKFAAEKTPDAPAKDFGVTKIEQEALLAYAKPTIGRSMHKPATDQLTIEEFCIILGQIGGFSPSKRQKIPGLKIMSRALAKFDTILKAYLLFCQRTE
jgi:hypothetical protein